MKITSSIKKVDNVEQCEEAVSVVNAYEDNIKIQKKSIICVTCG